MLVGLGAAWLAFVVLHRLLSGRFWLWLVPDLAPPAAYLAVPAVLLALAPLAGGRAALWAVGLAGAALLLGAGHGGLNRGRPSRATEPADALRIVSWNTGYWHQGVDPARFYAFLRDLCADVCVLQEYVYGPHRGLSRVDDLERLARELPEYRVVVQGELVTLSRLPVESVLGIGPARELCEHAGWREVYDATKVLRTDLRAGAAVVSVYNVHVPAQYAPGDNPLTRRFYRELRDRARQRRAQFAGLLADVAANRRPLIVTGDFNSTGAMGEMRPLLRRLACANRAGTPPYLASWRVPGPPLWQLDWTFTAGIQVHRYRLLDPRSLSDHRVQELLVSIEEEAS